MRLVLVATVLGALALARLPGEARSADPCGPGGNPIVCENAKPGSPASEWQISGAGDPSIQGFATDISVDRGQRIDFKISTDATDYRIDIYRLGWYGGDGARKVASIAPSASLPQAQPDCTTQSSTGLVDCGNWSVSASWSVPADAVSGLYIARPVRTDTGGASHIPFVVRDDERHSDVLVQTSDETWQAYNSYGGNSLYVGHQQAAGYPPGRAYAVSYNRPFDTRANEPHSWLFSTEYPMIRWLERNGYDVSYATDVDAARAPAALLQHRTYLVSGHDEYWSAEQRRNVEAAADAGVNLAFFAGDEATWKTRWAPSIDGADTPWRTVVCYKETAAGAKIDPSPSWTGKWGDASFSPPSDAGPPPNQLTGTASMVEPERDDAIDVPAADGRMRFWRDTSIAQLAPGTTASLPTGVLGYEWDGTPNNGFAPPGQIYLSSTTVKVWGQQLEDGSFGPADVTHHLSLYRRPSGALVFGAGTVQWAWGLDNRHDLGARNPDPRMQQATVNLLADMGVQPATLQDGLVPETASTDTTAPTASISSPAAGGAVARGSTVTVRGTAADTGGGVVGAVEVSADGGSTWHRAAGREDWTYTWRAGGFGRADLEARAVDDSGNLGRPSAPVEVTVTDCPCSLWDDRATPTILSDTDGGPYELGVRFRSDTSGSVVGVRFFHGPGNTGPHVAHLWTGDGKLLASAPFPDDASTGWQRVDFPSPVPIDAGSAYVASYSAPNGHFAVDRPYFASGPYDNPPLHAVQSSDGAGNGLYAPPGTFPTWSYRASNYWVDVVFTTP